MTLPLSHTKTNWSLEVQYLRKDYQGIDTTEAYELGILNKGTYIVDVYNVTGITKSTVLTVDTDIKVSLTKDKPTAIIAYIPQTTN